MRFPKSDDCFLCGEPIRFDEDDFEVTASFAHLPKGARRPTGFLWVHETCARRAADPRFNFPDAEHP